MNVTLLKGYPDFIGKRAAWAGFGSGPASYALGGDPLALPLANYYIDSVAGPALTVSGNYLVNPIPSGTGPRQTWKLKWMPVATGLNESGQPLTLGPLSAAASTSAMTANGVGTVVVANSLVPGNFVLLTGGASNKAIFMNGQIVQVVTASATQFTYNYGPAKALNYVSAADAALKFQLVLSGGVPVGLGTGTGQSATITAATVASQVITVTAANTFAVGQFVVLQGLAAGEVTNGIICHILTASTTQFTAAVQSPNVVNAGDTGTATLLVSAGNIPVALGSPATITGTTVAATAASATAAGAIAVLPVAQNFIPSNLMVVEGLTHGAVLNGQIYPVLAASLSGANVTANAYLNAAVTTGSADMGAASLLVSGSSASGEVAAGTNLSGELIQLGGFCGQY